MDINLSKFENDTYSVDVSHFRLDNARGVVIVFPGAGYSHMGPCIYYPSTALYKNGYEILNIEYDFRKEGLRDGSQESYEKYFTFLIENIKKLKLPSQKVAFCKSIGTRIVGSMETNLFDKIIWSTPALKDDYVYNSIYGLQEKSLVVIGDKDPFYSEKQLNELKNNSVQCLVIQGADHGLDIDGDLSRSLDEMKTIVSETLKFVKNV
mgnify:CR=1 FL=1